MNTDALLSRLREPDCGGDAAVLRIAEADYGCEDCAEDAPGKVWILLLRRDGTELSREVPEARIAALHLKEGSLFFLSDL